MLKIYNVLLLIVIFLFSGCTQFGLNSKTEDINCTKLAGKFNTYYEFQHCTNVRKSYKVFQDDTLLKKSTSKNTKMIIDVSEQRAKLYVDEKVALDAPCTTGAKHKFEPNTKIYRDKHTPMGTFHVMEKIQNKHSSIFGKYYKGTRCIYTGDKRKYKGNKRCIRYEGASLKNWMRLTGSGIGIHASKYIKRYPGTNGCIRLPYNISKTMFKYMSKGTPVDIIK